jgi:hypothetical protein
VNFRDNKCLSSEYLKGICRIYRVGFPLVFKFLAQGVTSKRFPQPLDVVALMAILVLALPIGILLYGGDSTHSKVKDFSWQSKQIGAENTAFILTFNRPMNWQSVAANLHIEPPLPGKASWSGRRFVYTLSQPIPYGKAFRVDLQNASEAVLGGATPRSVMKPFMGRFQSRDRAFVYLGVGGAEDGRLVLHNQTRQQTKILTPENLVVTSFRPYPEGSQILFAAIPRTPETQGIFEQKLYTVSTGFSQEQTAQVKLLLDNSDYQILKFDMSANGQSIVIQRYGRKRNAPVSLWVLQPNTPIRSLNHSAAGEFLVTPDGSAVAIAENQGINIVPIATEEDSHPPEYLPQLGMTIGFSRDASAATMVEFNPDSTRSLFLVTNQGVKKELLKTAGYILKTQFDPMNQTVFCLYTRLGRSEERGAALYISAIDILTGKKTTLVRLPGKTNGHMSLAPDGSQLLFDDIDASEQPSISLLKNEIGQAITRGTLWMLPLNPKRQPNGLGHFEPLASKLSISGIQPYWLP